MKNQITKNIEGYKQITNSKTTTVLFECFVTGSPIYGMPFGVKIDDVMIQLKFKGKRLISATSENGTALSPEAKKLIRNVGYTVPRNFNATLDLSKKTISREYWNATTADFNPVSNKLAVELLDNLCTWRRKKSHVITIDGDTYTVGFQSEKKSGYFRSRSKSFYFIKNGTELIRISDHWSVSDYKKSGKLNCGSIASCYWTANKNEAFTYCLPSERWESKLIAGTIKFTI